MPKPILSPTIFLDTNAIHNVVSYLILAEQFKLTPFGAINEIDRIKNELGNAGLPADFKNFIIQGLFTLAYLQNQVEEKDARVYISRLTMAELWYGRLDGQAHIRMSLHGIPYRQRQRQNIINKLVMSRLTEEDYDKVKSEFSNLSQNWYDKFGVELKYVEDEINTNDMLLLALEIQKLTFIDVIDCILMAGSLALLSTEFITGDGLLFDVIHYFKEPDSVPDKEQRKLWKNAQRIMLEELKKMHLSKSIAIKDLVKPIKVSKISSDVSKLHIISAS